MGSVRDAGVLAAAAKVYGGCAGLGGWPQECADLAFWEEGLGVRLRCSVRYPLCMLCACASVLAPGELAPSVYSPVREAARG